MRTLAACFSVRLSLKPCCALSWSVAFFLTLRAPVTAHCRCMRARSSRSPFCDGVLLVGLLRVAAGDGLGVEVAEPAAAELGAGAVVLVELEDPVDGGLQEGPVVGDDDQPAVGLVEEALQAGQTGEVEVVGGLVEEEDVEAGQEDGGQRGPGRLPARELAHLHRQPVGGQAQVGAHRLGPGLEVGAAQGQVPLEGHRVALVAPGFGQRRRRLLPARPRPPSPRCAGPGRRPGTPRAGRRTPGGGSRR